MVCETLLDPGDTVLVESPNFPGSMRTIKSFGAEQVAVPMDEYGLRVDALQVELKKLADAGKRAKFIYTIPTHQNPAGCTLDLKRRERLLELAQEHKTFILEDDAYGELWFETPPPPLFALSNGDHGVKVSSFSKIPRPACAWAGRWAAPLISRMASVRFDMGTSPYLPRQGGTIATGTLTATSSGCAGIYLRLDRVEAALKDHCAPYSSTSGPGWLLSLAGAASAWLPRCPTSGQRTRRHRRRGPSSSQRAGTNHIRLAFSYVAMEDIEEGIHRLGEAMAEVAACNAAK
jgi:2-aminoadipate transaminase